MFSTFRLWSIEWLKLIGIICHFSICFPNFYRTPRFDLKLEQTVVVLSLSSQSLRYYIYFLPVPEALKLWTFIQESTILFKFLEGYLLSIITLNLAFKELWDFACRVSHCVTVCLLFVWQDITLNVMFSLCSELMGYVKWKYLRLDSARMLSFEDICLGCHLLTIHCLL